jgi:hypothetical protein
MRVTDPRVIDRINDAQQELMNEGDFPGVVDRWHVVNQTGHIVLPPQLDRLMQIAIAGVPQTIKSPWFEFVNYGPGPAEDRSDHFRTWCDVDGILDHGETCTSTIFPTETCGVSVGSSGYNLRVYARRPEDAGIFATIQGRDINGEIISSQLTSGSSAGEWVNGVQVPISSGSAYFQTTERFAYVDAFTKPVTNGYVRLTAWDGVTETVLSNYAPNETEPSYRHYFCPWLSELNTDSNCCRVVRARCRRRFVPVAQDTDVLIISNVLAIKEMVIAQFNREAGIGDAYSLHKQTAVDILKKEAAGYRGKSRLPGLTFQRGFGIGTLPGLR